VAGTCLIIFTGGLGLKLGEFLITEGVSDAIYIAIAAKDGNLNLKDYATNKMISMTVSMTIGALKFARNAYKAS
jgi:hypothetical protein